MKKKNMTICNHWIPLGTTHLINRHGDIYNKKTGLLKLTTIKRYNRADQSIYIVQIAGKNQWWTVERVQKYYQAHYKDQVFISFNAIEIQDILKSIWGYIIKQEGNLATLDQVAGANKIQEAQAFLKGKIWKVKMNNKYLIRFIYDHIKSLNGHELTDEECAKIESVILSAYEVVSQENAMNFNFIISNEMTGETRAKLIAKILVGIIKGHILIDGNKRLALALVYGIFGSFNLKAPEIVDLLKDIAADNIKINLVKNACKKISSKGIGESGNIIFDWETDQAIRMLEKE